MGRFTDDYLLFLAAQASASLSAEFHGWLAARGVPVSTWRILASLHPDAALTIGELATMCLTKQPTMTRMVDRLAASGLVARREDKADRRRVSVSLTAEGLRMAEALVTEAKAHEARALPPAKAAALKRLLRALIPPGRGVTG